MKSHRGDQKKVTHGSHPCDEVDHLSLADTALDIRPLRETDLDFALALTESVGWGYTREDLAELHAYQPEGCLVATEDGAPVGMLTTVAYGPVGWIGNVVTEEAVRGRGFGAALVDAAVDYLRGVGVESVLLYAYQETVAFYAKLGFETQGEAVRVLGRGTARGGSPALAEDGDLDAVLRMDREAMGYPRDLVLKDLWSRYREAFHVAREGEEVVAYAVGPRGEGEGEIGPWICAPNAAADCEGLLDAVLAAVGETEVSMTIPAQNVAALEAVEARGFGDVYRVVLMAHGEPPVGRDEMVFAMGSLQKG